MKVESGDSVAVKYTGRLDSGEVFDSNDEEGSDPLVFRVGANTVIAGFESAILGLAKGESKTVRIPPEEAYGMRDDALKTQLDRKLFEGGEVEIDQQVDLEDAQGNMYEARVVAFDDKTVTVDFNHALAGEALTFELRVVGIERGQ